MQHTNMYLKAVVIRVILLIVVLTSIVSGAFANGLESDLWGINWASDPSQVTKALNLQGFSLAGQGQDTDGKWLKFEQGRFLELPCDIRLKWVGTNLKEINVYLKEKGPNTAVIYQELMVHYLQNYGLPSSTDSYYLKSFPPIKVEGAVWKVSGDRKTASEIYLTRMGTEEYSGEEPLDSRIDITIIKIDGQ